MKDYAGKRILIIVENLPVPFDRRVWQEATSLREAGNEVSVICPKTTEYPKATEVLDGVYIYRHALPFEAKGSFGYLLEYAWALAMQTFLTWKIFFTKGFDVIHACNPPDLIFLVALPFKLLFGKRFVFDHHDINPELYIAKFGKKGLVYQLLIFAEYLTFKLADISIATNESYKEIAITRGQMKAQDVYVVRSGPDLSRLEAVEPVESHRKNRKFLIGYIGVIGTQEGIDHLLQVVDHLVNKRGRQDIQFVIMGAGPSLGDMIQLSAEMGLEEYVDFPGRVSEIYLKEVLSTSDVCVNPDVFNEMNDKSTMNKIMEYMSFAKPIVQYDLKEGRFSAADASLYAKPNDIVDFSEKIESLLDDEATRVRMGEYGYHRVRERLSWEFSRQTLLNAYASL